MTDQQISAFPPIQMHVYPDTSGEVKVAGQITPIAPTSDLTETMLQLIGVVTETAQQLGRPVQATAVDSAGTRSVLIVDTDGNVTEHAQPTRRRSTPALTSDEALNAAPPLPSIPAAEAAGRTATAFQVAAAETPLEAAPEAPAPVDREIPTGEPGHAPAAAYASEIPSAPVFTTDTNKGDQDAPTRRSLRDTTFLVDDSRPDPATKGIRGLLTRAGIKQEPSAAELAERADTSAVSQHWPGVRTIAVVNRKGGSNKTPTVAALASVFARYGGGGVLAWDNNENQGTLGWRTQKGTHDASVLDVLRDRDRLLADTARQADIDGYLHHQEEDKYDVLRSDENDEGDHEIQADEVDTVHKIAEKYRRLIIMDSGNTARAANWRAMIEHTNQLVIPTTTMEDRAEAAKLTLQTLAARDEHSAQLAENAVVIISQWKPEDRAEAQRIAELFTPLVRAVVTVPYDEALKAGRIRYGALAKPTQRAWLAAAAAVARGL